MTRPGVTHSHTSYDLTVRHRAPSLASSFCLGSLDTSVYPPGHWLTGFAVPLLCSRRRGPGARNSCPSHRRRMGKTVSKAACLNGRLITGETYANWWQLLWNAESLQKAGLTQTDWKRQKDRKLAFRIQKLLPWGNRAYLSTILYVTFDSKGGKRKQHKKKYSRFGTAKERKHCELRNWLNGIDMICNEC